MGGVGVKGGETLHATPVLCTLWVFGFGLWVVGWLLVVSCWLLAVVRGLVGRLGLLWWGNWLDRGCAESLTPVLSRKEREVLDEGTFWVGCFGI